MSAHPSDPPAGSDRARLVWSLPAGLEWRPLAPGSKGSIVSLWGDHTKGGYGALIRFPAGYTSPVHTHTHDMRIVVLSGTFLQIPEGEPALRLPPGSYLLQPGGNYRHIAAVDPSSDCIFFAESPGAFDQLP